MLSAAYLLGEMQSDEAVDASEGLTHVEESVRRASCYGLKVSGAAQADKHQFYVDNQRLALDVAVYTG